MDQIRLKKREILEYVYDMLNTYKMYSIEVENARFHHNTNYNQAPSLIQNGILSLNSMNNLGIRNDSAEYLLKMSVSDSHINGIDGISLSVAGLKDLDPKKFEYDPFQNNMVDFLITSNIPTIRSTYHYDNEYVTYKDITTDLFRAIDIRLISFLEEVAKNENLHTRNEQAIELMNMYNHLRQMAIVLNNKGLNIPLREMSNNSSVALNVDKLAKTPQLLLK